MALPAGPPPRGNGPRPDDSYSHLAQVVNVRWQNNPDFPTDDGVDDVVLRTSGWKVVAMRLAPRQRDQHAQSAMGRAGKCQCPPIKVHQFGND